MTAQLTSCLSLHELFKALEGKQARGVAAVVVFVVFFPPSTVQPFRTAARFTSRACSSWLWKANKLEMFRVGYRERFPRTVDSIRRAHFDSSVRILIRL